MDGIDYLHEDILALRTALATSERERAHLAQALKNVCACVEFDGPRAFVRRNGGIHVLPDGLTAALQAAFDIAWRIT